MEKKRTKERKKEMLSPASYVEELSEEILGSVRLWYKRPRELEPLPPEKAKESHHECGGECDWTNNGRAFVCQHGNLHICDPDLCETLVVQRDCLVCRLTGRIYALPPVDCAEEGGSGFREDAMVPMSIDMEESQPAATTTTTTSGPELFSLNESSDATPESKILSKRYRKQLRQINREEQKRKEQQQQLTDVHTLSRIPKACRPDEMGRYHQKQEYRQVVLDLLRFKCGTKKPSEESLIDPDLLCRVVDWCTWSWALVTRSPCFRSCSSAYRHNYHALVVVYKMREGFVVYNEGRRLEVLPQIDFFRQQLPTLRSLPLVKNKLDRKWTCRTYTACNKLLRKLINAFTASDLEHELEHRDLCDKKSKTGLYAVHKESQTK